MTIYVHSKSENNDAFYTQSFNNDCEVQEYIDFLTENGFVYQVQYV